MAEVSGIGFQIRNQGAQLTTEVAKSVIQAPIDIASILIQTGADGTKNYKDGVSRHAKDLADATKNAHSVDVTKAASASGKLALESSGFAAGYHYGKAFIGSVKDYFSDLTGSKKQSSTAKPKARAEKPATPAPKAAAATTSKPETEASKSTAPAKHHTKHESKEVADKTGEYTIKKGDTLFGIVSKKTGITDKQKVLTLVGQIQKENGISDASKITAGSKLTLGGNKSLASILGGGSPKVDKAHVQITGEPTRKANDDAQA